MHRAPGQTSILAEKIDTHMYIFLLGTCPHLLYCEINAYEQGAFALTDWGSNLFLEQQQRAHTYLHVSTDEEHLSDLS